MKYEKLKLIPPAADTQDWDEWILGLMRYAWFRQLDSEMNAIPTWQIFDLYAAERKRQALLEHIGRQQCVIYPPHLRS